MTDARQLDALRAFYAQELARVAEQAGERSAFFPTGPDAAATSYYGTRTAGGEYIFEFSPARLADELRERWADEPRLLELIGALTALADRLADAPEEPTDVSSLVYPMF